MLSPAQLTTLKNDIAANTNTIPSGQPWTGAFAGQQIKDVANNGDGNSAIAGWYSLMASPAYYVIRTDAPTVDIRNNVTGANYTPADDPTSANAAQATAASNYCMAKQQNLVLLGVSPGSGVTSFDASKATNVASLKDATTKLPSATGFANQTGGWPNIIPVLQRTCRNIEKLFVVASTINVLRNAGSSRGTQYDGTNGNPDVMGFEGAITFQDIEAARNS